MASGSDDKTVKIWDWKTGKVMASLADECGISSIATVDNYTLATGTYAKLKS